MDERNRHFLDYGIWRADNPLSHEREFDFAVQSDLTNVYKAIAALADWVGYGPQPQEPKDFNVDAERTRMAELHNTIEGLKNGAA